MANPAHDTGPGRTGSQLPETQTLGLRGKEEDTVEAQGLQLSPKKSPDQCFPGYAALNCAAHEVYVTHLPSPSPGTAV